MHVHNDYSSYESVPVNTDEFGHVIEIYNFPGQFKTDDLLDAFTDYRYVLGEIPLETVVSRLHFDT